MPIKPRLKLALHHGEVPDYFSQEEQLLPPDHFYAKAVAEYIKKMILSLDFLKEAPKSKFTVYVSFADNQQIKVIDGDQQQLHMLITKGWLDAVTCEDELAALIVRCLLESAIKDSHYLKKPYDALEQVNIGFTLLKILDTKHYARDRLIHLYQRLQKSAKVYALELAGYEREYGLATDNHTAALPDIIVANRQKIFDVYCVQKVLIENNYDALSLEGKLLLLADIITEQKHIFRHHDDYPTRFLFLSKKLLELPFPPRIKDKLDFKNLTLKDKLAPIDAFIPHQAFEKLFNALCNYSPPFSINSAKKA